MANSTDDNVRLKLTKDPDINLCRDSYVGHGMQGIPDEFFFQVTHPK